jgi:hypothetical protein
MITNDSLLDFSFSLMSAEFPSMDPTTVSTVRSWISGFLSSRLSSSKFHELALKHSGTANIVDKLQEIVTMSSKPMPEPRIKGLTPLELKDTRNNTRLWISQEDSHLLTDVGKFGLGAGSTW